MKKFNKKLFLIIFLIIFSKVSFGQSMLEVFPDTLKYTSIFNRLQQILIYNKSNEIITIDSIYIDENIYYMRFDKNPVFPIILQPSDSLLMDCILWNYWVYENGVYDSTVIIYSNASNNFISINSRINIESTATGYGIIQGTVNSDDGPVQNAKIFFYKNGTNLISSTETNEEGEYSISLLEGNYFVSVEKEGFYLLFYEDKVSPIDADFIDLKKYQILDINFKLKPIQHTSLSISGNIIDKLVGRLSKKRGSGIVVVRKGSHNPSKILSSQNNDEKIFVGIINPDGSYSIENIQEPGYYYIMAFSEFYIPAYYTKSDSSTFFWQNADSVFIDNELKNYDIYLERDSSYGAGEISGKINLILDSSLVNTIVYAQSINGFVYTYNFVDSKGNYKITALPYGEYKIIAQAFGYENAVSSFIKIDEQNPNVSNVDLEFSEPINNGNDPLLTDFELHQNYPNPFNPSTKIFFKIFSNSNNIIQKEKYILKVFDILGREVTTLLNDELTSGDYQIEFNGESLSSGVYFYRLQSSSKFITKKMLLIR